jgi:hypothetical protein
VAGTPAGQQVPAGSSATPGFTATPGAPTTPPGQQLPTGTANTPGFTAVPQPAPAAPAAPAQTPPNPFQFVTPAPPTPVSAADPVTAPAAPAATLPPSPQQAGGQPAPVNPFAPPAAQTPATVLVSPPGTEFRTGGGPYLVPISISNASRLSTVSISLSFNPSVLRVRTVQEGSLMRQGGAQAAFTQRIDAAAGRVDIAIVRPGDVLGASGTGVVGAVLFEAIGAGQSPLSLSGVGTLAGGGGAAPFQFQPVTVTVK